MAYLHRALCKHKPATLVVSVEESEKTDAFIFKGNTTGTFCGRDEELLKKIQRLHRIAVFKFFYEEKRYRAKGISKNQSDDFNVKHPMLLHWKTHSAVFFLRNEQKNHRHEVTKLKKILFNRRCRPSAYETSYEKSSTRTLHAEKAEQKRLHH